MKFKRKLLPIIRPVGKSFHNIHDIEGVRCLVKPRLNFSALNEHRFRHNFDCLGPICNCGTGSEDNEHFFLHCPQSDLMCADLVCPLSQISALDLNNLNSKAFFGLLLYGSLYLNIITNRIIKDMPQYHTLRQSNIFSKFQI